jgi:hypothetical protein
MSQNENPKFTQAQINVAIMESEVPMTESQKRGEFCRYIRDEKKEYVYEECAKENQVSNCALCNPSRKH